MKKSKKKLKGMTLVEVLVALAVFSIISAVLASSVAMICSIVRKTDRLNEKITQEAPAAELRSGEQYATDNFTITVGGYTKTVTIEMYQATEPTDNTHDEGGDFKYFKP